MRMSFQKVRMDDGWSLFEIIFDVGTHEGSVVSVEWLPDFLIGIVDEKEFSPV